MVRARKAYQGEGLTQKELGARVGTSQNVISLIEAGEVTSSTFILPICDVLGIPPPMLYENEDQQLWSQLGRVLRHKSMRKFRRAMALVEAMVDDDEEAAKPAEEAPAAPPPRK